MTCCGSTWGLVGTLGALGGGGIYSLEGGGGLTRGAGWRMRTLGGTPGGRIGSLCGCDTTGGGGGSLGGIGVSRCGVNMCGKVKED